MLQCPGKGIRGHKVYLRDDRAELDQLKLCEVEAFGYRDDEGEIPNQNVKDLRERWVLQNKSARVGEVTFESNLVTSYKLLAPCNWKFRYIAVTSFFNFQKTDTVKFLPFDDRNLLITSEEMRQQAWMLWNGEKVLQLAKNSLKVRAKYIETMPFHCHESNLTFHPVLSK